MFVHELRRAILAILFTFAIGITLFSQHVGHSDEVQGAPRPAQGTPGTEANCTSINCSATLLDGLQRSVRINTYKAAAESGVVRGETIYYYKCWVCHNKYTIAANPGPTAPYLQDLFKHENLPRSGNPITDESVTAAIKDGNPQMPSFRSSLSNADLADLLSYLKSGKCCLEGEDPPPNPWYKAVTNRWSVPTTVSGGARGVVRSKVGPGDSPEGIKVQLIAPNGVRTTVYTNEEGYYEFPKMQTGEYTLRIATPLEFKPYRRDGVRIDGATKLDDIVLERATIGGTAAAESDAEALSPTGENESQLSGAEILWNLSGTANEKATFFRACGNGCHSYAQIFRNRYDERSWGLIVDRMFNYGPAILIRRATGIQLGQYRGTPEDQQIITKWLAKVRGPGMVDGPLYLFPRPRGASTRLVVTEYELPRQLLSAHDVSGDSKGNIWYSDYKTRFFGKLDPRTGIITEYSIPLTPGFMTGTHAVIVDQKHGDLVWLSEAWNNKWTKMDSKTGQLTQFNDTPNGNFALAPDGSIWSNKNQAAIRVDPETGKVSNQYPMPGRAAYGVAVSDDGHYWAAGGPSTGGNYGEFLDIRTGRMTLLNMGGHLPGPSRGGFDPFGNAWFGGKNGSLVEIDTKAAKMREFFPPTVYAPYSAFYEAWSDKNGEVWAGLLHGRGMVRYNPRTSRWIEYALPEPYGHDRKTWIDNTTNPVTVWYVDYQGYLVRIQPLE